MNHLIILGGSGFIGGAMAAHCKSRFSGVEVTAHSTRSLDLLKSSAAEELAREITPQTVVIACAAKMKREGDALRMCEENVGMAFAVCRAVQLRSPKQVVFLSSAAVYGEDLGNTAITEETSRAARSFYGLSKCLSEDVYQFSVKPPASLLIIRPPFVYGPGDTSPYTPSGFLRSALAQQEIAVWGDGSEMREFIFIEDFVELTARLIERNASGVFNMPSGAQHSFKDALDIVASLCPYPLRLSSRPRTKDKVDTLFVQTKVRALFPEFQFTSLEEGLRRTLETARG